MPSRVAFDKEIKSFAGSIANAAIADRPAFLDACFAAAEFLSSIKVTKPQLTALESRVQATIGVNLVESAKGQLAARIDSLKQPAKNGTAPALITPKDIYAKKVTSTLGNILKTPGGFSDQVPKFVNFVQTTAFNQNLQDNKQWKDPGVSPAHGEFTHQVQWALLVLQFGAQIGAYSISKLFQDIGKIQAPIDGVEQGLWQMILDRGIDPFPNEGSTDFREPNNLLEYVTLRPNDFPILAGFFQARKSKREMEFKAASNAAPEFYIAHKELLKSKNLANDMGISSDILWSINYVTRKKYPGRSFDALNPGEKTAVLDAVNAAIL